MKTRSKRGAARVSAVWLIVFVVCFLVALGVAWTQGEEASRAEQEYKAYKERAETAEKKAEDGYKTTVEISKALGFYDRAVQNAFATPASAKESLDKLKTTFALPDSVQDFEEAIEPLVARYTEKLKEIQRLQGDLATATAQVSSLDQASKAAARTKDDEISRLTKDLSDERNGRSEDKAELERRVSTVSAARNSLDGELKTVQGQLDDEKRARRNDQQEHSTRMNYVTSQLRFLREPETSDGEILATSKTLGMGWINLGAAKRVSRGMEFRVESGNPATPGHVKGYARVVSVEEDRSEVLLYDLTDPWDAIVTGDKIFNPLYDPKGNRNAVLIGRFSGIYNEKELRMLLEGIGIHVQNKLDRETDYLLVGAELYQDESGEPLEEPIQPSDLPEYKQAEADGVQIVPIRDVIRFFKK